MNMKVVLGAIILLAAGLYVGYKYQFAPVEVKNISPEEKIALQNNMTIKEIIEQEAHSVRIWREVLQETSLYDQLGDASRFFIIFLITDDIMTAPLIATEAAIDNLLEKWRALSLNKKVEIAKNYIIPTEKPWRPEVGTESFATLGGKKLSITTTNFKSTDQRLTSVNTKKITVNNISDIGIVQAGNGILLMMPELIWKDDATIFKH